VYFLTVSPDPNLNSESFFSIIGSYSGLAWLPQLAVGVLRPALRHHGGYEGTTRDALARHSTAWNSGQNCMKEHSCPTVNVWFGAKAERCPVRLSISQAVSLIQRVLMTLVLRLLINGGFRFDSANRVF